MSTPIERGNLGPGSIRKTLVASANEDVMKRELSNKTSLKLWDKKGRFMSEKMFQAVEAILKRGNNVEIRRKGDGYIVLEVKKTIKYSA